MHKKNSTILMVPPMGFEYNPETALSNSFQTKIQIPNAKEKALAEHSKMVERLRGLGITVLLLEQSETLPDAVFPNNWFSTHLDDNENTIQIIYPMLTQNRRAEVNIEGLTQIFKDQNIPNPQIIDLRNTKNQILEGTGSLVLDKTNKIMYASLSPRTSLELANKVAELLDCTLLVFNSVDEFKDPIYHTNVMMSIAKDYVVICLESIEDITQRIALQSNLERTNKLIIDISLEQMSHFCGNLLELFNDTGQSLLIMSSQAYQHFTKEQLAALKRYSQIVAVDIETIETLGGGSARCMIAEIEL